MSCAIVYAQVPKRRNPRYTCFIAKFRFGRPCAGGGPGRYWPPRMRCRRCRTQAGHPFPGTQLPLTQPDTPVRGPVLPALKPGGAREPVPAGEHAERQHILPGRGSQVRVRSKWAGAWAGGLCRAGGLPQSLMPEVPAGLLVPAEVSGQYPGHTGPGKVRRRMISDRPSQVLSLGGNRAPGPYTVPRS
jgi:hypothetical protein